MGPALDGGAEHQLFRIVQEALTNAVRHGRPSKVEVRMRAAGDLLELEVSDDGRGFDPEGRAHRGRRLGLTSMRERAAALGGELSIRSAPGEGTTVHLEVPA